jgi:DNA-binding NarL/FixJ family response regulator
LIPREHEILLSIKTIEWHRDNLISKLGVRSVTDLVHYALQHQLMKED